MAYFKDFTFYEYGPRREPEGILVLNIGWLDSKHLYVSGAAPKNFIECLELIVRNDKLIVNRTRGFHQCEFCKAAVGGAEIRIPGSTGIIYAAPTLIYHYVKEHKYLPPQEFIDAVLRLQ